MLRDCSKAAHNIILPDEEMTETRGGATVNELKTDINDKIPAHIKILQMRRKTLRKRKRTWACIFGKSFKCKENVGVFMCH